MSASGEGSATDPTIAFLDHAKARREAVRQDERAAQNGQNGAVPPSGEAHRRQNGQHPPTSAELSARSPEEVHPYVRDLLADECGQVASAVQGNRNTQLNNSSVKVGHWVPHELPQDQAAGRLFEAGCRSGLPEAEVLRTIASGLDKGMSEPRQIPDKDGSAYLQAQRNGSGPIPQGGPASPSGASHGTPGETPAALPEFDDAEPPEYQGVPDVPHTFEECAEYLLARDEQGSPLCLAAGVPAGLDPEEFWRARLMYWQVWRLAREKATNPWATFGALLARTIVACDYRIVLPGIIGGQASMNMFVNLVGRSGDGKGACVKVARGRADIAVPDDVPDGFPMGSAEGAANLLVDTGNAPDGSSENWTNEAHAAWLHVDEIEGLGAVAGRSGTRNILPEMRKMWMGETLGGAYRKANRIVVPEMRYRLCMTIGVQPAKSGVLLSQSEIDGGTPQRFIWLPTRVGYQDLSRPVEHAGRIQVDLPEMPSAGSSRWTWGVKERYVEIAVPDAVENVVRQEANLRRAGYGSGALDAHSTLCRLKVAGGLALLDGRLDMNIEDWHLSALVMTISFQTREHCAEELRRAAREEAERLRYARGRDAIKVRQMTQEEEDREIETVSDRVLEILNDIIKKPASAGQISHKASTRQKRFVPEVMQNLVSEEILEQVGENRRREPLYWFAKKGDPL